MKVHDDSKAVKCPACLIKTGFRPVSTVTEGTKELRDLFMGVLNKARCLSCAVEFLVDTPITYRDDKERFLVYYAPLAATEEIQDVINLVERLYKHIFEGLPSTDKPKCRIALSRKDFY